VFFGAAYPRPGRHGRRRDEIRSEPCLRATHRQGRQDVGASVAQKNAPSQRLSHKEPTNSSQPQPSTCWKTSPRTRAGLTPCLLCEWNKHGAPAPPQRAWDGVFFGAAYPRPGRHGRRRDEIRSERRQEVGASVAEKITPSQRLSHKEPTGPSQPQPSTALSRTRPVCSRGCESRKGTRRVAIP